MLKVTGQGKLPERSYNSAGYDLFAYLLTDYVIKPGCRMLIPTGICIQIDTEDSNSYYKQDDNFYIRIAPRSGLALKNGIDVFAGVVDKDYRGEIGVILYNSGTNDFVVKNGDKIAQMIIEKYHVFPVKRVEKLDTTERGMNGFGSTDTLHKSSSFDNGWEKCI